MSVSEAVLLGGARPVTVRTSTRSDGLERVVVENERLSLTLLPGLGAKIVGLFDRLVEREWMAPPVRGYRYAEPGDAFGDHDCSGWDECFPNIAPGAYPVSGSGMAPPLLDHGELWSQSWMVELGDDEVSATVSGFHFPYSFERRLHLEGDRVLLDYQLRNTGNRPFRCLWSAHPLFSPSSGMRLMVPVSTVYSNDAPRTREQYEWPVATMVDGTREDLSAFGARSGLALKLFTAKGAVRRVALADTDAAAAWVGMDFDPKLCPYLGLWLNEGGWPEGAPLQHVALDRIRDDTVGRAVGPRGRRSSTSRWSRPRAAPISSTWRSSSATPGCSSLASPGSGRSRSCSAAGAARWPPSSRTARREAADPGLLGPLDPAPAGSRASPA